jgi:hypothetical protein
MPHIEIDEDVRQEWPKLGCDWDIIGKSQENHWEDGKSPNSMEVYSWEHHL